MYFLALLVSGGDFLAAAAAVVMPKRWFAANVGDGDLVSIVVSLDLLSLAAVGVIFVVIFVAGAVECAAESFIVVFIGIGVDVVVG